MLFELGGRRKRFIQVIYVMLALLMGGGLIFFGIGGAQGGLGDAIGIGGNTTSTDPAYDNQIERAEATLATDPEDEKALIALARTQFLAGQSAVEADEQGIPILTEEAEARYAAAVDAWERYLETEPQKPDDGLASLMIRSYASLSSGADGGALEDQLSGASEAARIVAEARPSVGTNAELASYAYLAGEDEIAARAEQEALAEADPTTRSQIETQIASAKRQAKQIAAFIKGTAPTEDQLENPTSGLGGGSVLPGDQGFAP